MGIFFPYKLLHTCNYILWSPNDRKYFMGSKATYISLRMWLYNNYCHQLTSGFKECNLSKC